MCRPVAMSYPAEPLELTPTPSFVSTSLVGPPEHGTLSPPSGGTLGRRASHTGGALRQRRVTDGDAEPEDGTSPPKRQNFAKSVRRRFSRSVITTDVSPMKMTGVRHSEPRRVGQTVQGGLVGAGVALIPRPPHLRAVFLRRNRGCFGSRSRGATRAQSRRETCSVTYRRFWTRTRCSTSSRSHSCWCACTARSTSRSRCASCRGCRCMASSTSALEGSRSGTRTFAPKSLMSLRCSANEESPGACPVLCQIQ